MQKPAHNLMGAEKGAVSISNTQGWLHFTKEGGPAN